MAENNPEYEGMIDAAQTSEAGGSQDVIWVATGDNTASTEGNNNDSQSQQPAELPEGDPQPPQESLAIRAQTPEPLTKFTCFPDLPPELRSRIFRMAMLEPAIIYFSMQPSHFEEHIHLHALSKCNSSWRQWKTIAQVSPEAAHVVNLVVTQGATKHYVDLSKKRPFNRVDDLLVLQFTTNSHMINPWTVATAAPANFVYRSYFRSIRRIGFKWNEKTFRCHGHIEDEIPADWPVYHANGDDEDTVRCTFPCKDIFTRFPLFFRDADVVYILFTAKAKDLAPFFKSQAKSRRVPLIAHTANFIRSTPAFYRDDPEIEIETRCDARQKWVEVPITRAKRFLDESRIGP